MGTFDPKLHQYYSEGKEKDRLIKAKLEKDRTLHILKKRLPEAPAILVDVGGGAGAYAFPLAEMGYQVHLLDPIEVHIEQAKQQAPKLASIRLGDARSLPFSSESADAVLLLGPLYHLTSKTDRHRALLEAYRVLKPGGVIFAAGISRFASLMDYMNKGTIYTKMSNIKNDLATGVHRKSEDPDFIFGYFHHPKELKEELFSAGFKSATLHAIEGPIWASSLIDPLVQNEAWPNLIALLDLIEEEETLIGSSAHILAIGQK